MTNTNLLNKYHSDVTHYRSIISHTSHHKVDHEFFLKPENAAVMHDARKLVENFYKPTKPYGGADYERLNLGFRALKQGVPYEVVDKLLSMPLEYDRLLLMLGAFADGRTAEEIKYLYSESGDKPNKLWVMEVIKEALDAGLELDEIKEFRKVRRAENEYSEYVKCRAKGLNKEASAFVCELGSAYLDNSIKLLSMGLKLDKFKIIMKNIRQCYFARGIHITEVEHILSNLSWNREENHLTDDQLVFITSYGDMASPTLLSVKVLANALISGMSQEELQTVLDTITDDNELQSRIECSRFTSQVDALVNLANNAPKTQSLDSFERPSDGLMTKPQTRSLEDFVTGRNVTSGSSCSSRSSCYG